VKIECRFRKYRKKFYPPTFGKSSAITRLISYQTYPIKNVLEAAKVIQEGRKDLEKITQPCFLMQSTSDHIVSRSSMENIFNQISSKIKNKKYIKRAYHTFISDIKNENVLGDILNFLNSI
jgi:esterase/lipase